MHRTLEKSRGSQARMEHPVSRRSQRRPLQAEAASVRSPECLQVLPGLMPMFRRARESRARPGQHLDRSPGFLTPWSLWCRLGHQQPSSPSHPGDSLSTAVPSVATQAGIGKPGKPGGRDSRYKPDTGPPAQTWPPSPWGILMRYYLTSPLTAHELAVVCFTVGPSPSLWGSAPCRISSEAALP